MNVTILGTGSIYSKSNCASLLIDEHILVDVGPSIVKYLIKNNYDLLKIDNIILTHLHTDHILDFPTFIVNIGELGSKHMVNVYAPKETKTKLLDYTALCNGVNDIIKNSKVIVTDCSFIKGNDYHMVIDDIQKLIQDYPNKELILPHFRDKTKDRLKEMNLKNILLIEDGYSFKIEE